MIQRTDSNTNEIKAILIGDSGVGKTCLINTCAGFNFDSKPSLTMNCSFIQKRFNINNKEYIVTLVDTIGQESYLSVNKMFYRGSEVVIFVFDITNKESLYGLDFWIKNVLEELGTNFACGLVGNKNDLFLDAKVSEEEAKKYASSKGIKCKMCSAKTDPESFSDFLEQLITQPLSQNKLKIDTEKSDKNENDKKDNNKDNQKDKNDKVNKELNSNIAVINKKRGASIKLKPDKNQNEKGSSSSTSNNKKTSFC